MQRVAVSSPGFQHGASISQSFQTAFQTTFATFVWMQNEWCRTDSEVGVDRDVLDSVMSLSGPRLTATTCETTSDAGGLVLAVPVTIGQLNFVAVGRVRGVSREIALSVAQQLASDFQVIVDRMELFDQNEQLLVSVTRSLVATLEAKDQYTRGHSERVALYAKRISVELGLDSVACERIYLTGLLHDIGKIAVPDATLNKRDRLTEEEMDQIRRHPEAGWHILRDLEPLRYVLPGVLHHHERIDGKGYPHQLGGDEIPVEGRILAVADSYDAMTSNRSYRRELCQNRAETVLESGVNTQWDQDVIKAAFSSMADLVRIRETYYSKPSGLFADRA